MARNALTIDEIRDGTMEAFRPFNPRRVILFGSHAAGNADSESDVDLIVVYDTDKRFLDRLSELYTAWPFSRAVDILAYTPAEFDELVASRTFVRDAVSAGTVLYERG